ncbi:MAG: hypothetical protein CMD90_00370 [Gammaproteobacteria bacterium]|nr:hypothetical protein [Gammaproteobacteria bacterium]
MKLIEKIHKKVKQNLFITFDDFMEISLYYPSLGYYDNKNISLNPKNSDFITAPELSSLYAKSIANFYLQCRKYTKINNVLEFGPGSGKLAYDFLNSLKTEDIDNYIMYEKSGALRKQQEDMVKGLPPDLQKKVIWEDNISHKNNSFIIANEVIDAMPVKIFTKKNNMYYEKIIILKDNELQWSHIDADDKLKLKIEEIEESIKYKFPDGYTSEISFSIKPWLKNLFSNLNGYIMVLVDYGYDRKEYYHPQKLNGNIQYYSKKRKINNPLLNPGNVDISCNVNFSDIYDYVKESDRDLMLYTTQTEFLLKNNILNSAQTISNEHEKNSVLKTLLFPTDMGETFKVMVICDEIGDNQIITAKDYRHKL